MKLIDKKKEEKDVKELIPIEKIEQGSITLKNGKVVAVYKVEPTNFKLKTALEQKAILEGYKLFLKRCNFDMQIIVQTQKRDLSKYIRDIKENTKASDDIREMANDYICFLKEVTEEKDVFSKNFYILVKLDKATCEDDYIKIKESLSECDNDVEKCSNEETIKLLKNYLNRESV